MNNNAYNSKHSPYPSFGMVMPGREYAAEEYKFGFNGKEKERHIFESCLAFEARIFDSRVGRWFTVDPRHREYSWQSSYAYFGNSPIFNLDYLGEGEPRYYQNNNRRYRVERVKFMSHLTRSERSELRSIERENATSGTGSGATHTTNVNNFIATLDAKYSDQSWYYRRSTNSSTNESTGQYSMTKFSSILAYHTDPTPTSTIMLAPSPVFVPLAWVGVPGPLGSGQMLFTNTSGTAAQVVATVSAGTDGATVNANASISTTTRGTTTTTLAVNSNVTPAMQPWTSTPFNVPAGSTIIWSNTNSGGTGGIPPTSGLQQIIPAGPPVPALRTGRRELRSTLTPYRSRPRFVNDLGS